MNDQNNADKLAAIRNAMILFDNRVEDDSIQISRDFHQESTGYVRFLLSEVDRLQEIDDRGRDMAMSISAENRKLQEENKQLRHRDRVVSLANETLGRYVREGKEQIQSIQQVRDKLIKGLRWYASAPAIKLPVGDSFDLGGKAREILREIGVREADADADKGS